MSEMINVSELKPHPRNPNTHTENQLKKIAKGIDKLGWGRPIIISKDNFILIGHGAFRATVEFLGLDEVPFRRVKHLHDSEDAIALMLSDNRLAEDSERDVSLLNDIFVDLDSLDYDLSLTGYELEDLELGSNIAYTEANSENIANDNVINDEDFIPDFKPSENDTRLDKKKKHICPECGCKFE